MRIMMIREMAVSLAVFAGLVLGAAVGQFSARTMSPLLRDDLRTAIIVAKSSHETPRVVRLEGTLDRIDMTLGIADITIDTPYGASEMIRVRLPKDIPEGSVSGVSMQIHLSRDAGPITATAIRLPSTPKL